MLTFQGPIGVLTTSTGSPVAYEDVDTLNSQLLLNAHFLDTITAIVTKNIPERVVHAKGTGAFGYFEVTHDFTDICMADFLNKVGKKTPVGVRFSTTTGEKGTSDLNRDIRGFAVKFYTKDGNLDLVGLNIPVYFYKDPVHFRSFVLGRRRNPATNLLDNHAAWDLLSLLPESLPSFMLVLAERTIPASFRNMPGHPIHTFQVVNKKGEYFFCRFHFLPDAGIKVLSAQEARRLNNIDNDYLTRDLFRSIGNGDFPSWTLNAQVLNMSDVKRLGPDVFDVTKTISEKDFPLRPIGKLVLNRNAKNFFAEIEQMAVCPSNVVKGFLGAPDKLFEGRALAYRSAHVHRLGRNVNKIPVNCPFQTRVLTYNRDGEPPVGDNEEDAPHYYPNSFHGPVPYMQKHKTSLIKIQESYANNFDEARMLYVNEFSDRERSVLVSNICQILANVTNIVRYRLIKVFHEIHPDFSNRVAQGLNMTVCLD